MKILIPKIILFNILLLIINLSTKAQDYVFTNKNDTIRCKIRSSVFSGGLKYRANKTDNFIKIDSNIIEYFISSDTSNYIRKQIPESNYYRYVKRLERGKINLYEDNLTSTVNITETTWYVSKGQGDLIKIKHSSFSVTGIAHSQKKEKKAFMDLIADDSDLADKFNLAGRYDDYIIRQYIKLYNRRHSTDTKFSK